MGVDVGVFGLGDQVEDTACCLSNDLQGENTSLGLGREKPHPAQEKEVLRLQSSPTASGPHPPTPASLYAAQFCPKSSALLQVPPDNPLTHS